MNVATTHREPHTPTHPHHAHRASLTVNDRVALCLASILGSMWTAYLFIVWACIGLSQVHSLRDLVPWFSQTFVQLVALSVLQVAANLAQRAADHRADTLHRMEKRAIEVEQVNSDRLDNMERLLAIIADKLEVTHESSQPEQPATPIAH